jgi:voltage-dependent potassium channel beta subunit
MVESAKPKMEYRYLGNSGLRVSVLSFGNWLNSNSKENYEITRDAIKLCFDNGVNFFDTAEIYGYGEAEIQMGRAFKELGLKREELVVSTKILRSGNGVNDTFLSRKHIFEAINAQLKRLQLDYVDVLFCHRPDYDTPLEETCRALHSVIEQGKAFYWGTSEWTADRITKALEICDKLGLHKPIVEQPQYSMFVRNKFENEYRFLFQEYKYGTTIWSPLAGGILSGKYNNGDIPDGSRFDSKDDSKRDSRRFLDATWNQFMGPATKDNTIKVLKGLEEIAKDLGYTQAQLALAWAIANKDVSTCILGFSRLSQVEENLKAVELYHKWTPEIENRVADVLNNAPEAIMDWRAFCPLTNRRLVALAGSK